MRRTSIGIERYIDKYILLYIGILGVISCVFIYSSTEVFAQYSGSFVTKQMIFYFIGFTFMMGIAFLKMEHLKKIDWYFYALIVLLLVGLIFAPESIAKPVNEAKAWYQIKWLGSFQPSEFLKVAFVLVVAKLIESHHEKIDNQTFLSDCLLLGKIAAVTIPPILLVYQQPDTGMIMLYAALLIPMLYFSAISKKILISFALIPVTLLIAIIIAYFQFPHFYSEQLVGQLSPHQISRINGWLHPFEHEDSAYQTRQGILAIGSGEVTGKGVLGNNVYVPEKHTDFIFATVAEELGFIGGALVILLYFLLIYRFLLTIVRANSTFAYAAGAGIIGLFAFQICQNIGMTMGLLPVTGVTLPFLSYGGSSLLSNFMLIGIMLAFIKIEYEEVSSS
ncbi:FtsW/RodA/SpoVE family cell cycle protein [Lysinibacillus sp. KU-BSD001]|uniref:FtsW/RodA/SpoVE family cell cycle protein n=1 Tax=Lysinibacillus sp. KU-BSD001 TaxID=3141328 RepID=UPI0036EF41B1